MAQFTHVAVDAIQQATAVSLGSALKEVKVYTQRLVKCLDGQDIGPKIRMEDAEIATAQEMHTLEDWTVIVTGQLRDIAKELAEVEARLIQHMRQFLL